MNWRVLGDDADANKHVVQLKLPGLKPPPAPVEKSLIGRLAVRLDFFAPTGHTSPACGW